MSNNTAYVRTLFDDARYQLEGAVQSGAKWPPALAIKPHVDEYKGYTNTFVRFVVRTNIEGDRNNGIIEVKVPVQDWYKLGALIDNLNGEDVKVAPIDSYEKPFGRDKKPSKEPVLMGKINLGVREGRVYIVVTDARNDQRVKIPFYFGTPYTRTPFSTQGEKGDFTISKAAAQGWHKALSDILAPALKEMQVNALRRSTTMKRDDDSNSGGNGSYGNGGYDNTSSDDEDLPF